MESGARRIWSLMDGIRSLSVIPTLPSLITRARFALWTSINQESGGTEVTEWEAAHWWWAQRKPKTSTLNTPGTLNHHKAAAGCRSYHGLRKRASLFRNNIQSTNTAKLPVFLQNF